MVTPSRWLGDCARKSSLFKNTRVEVIPNGIDTNLYKPLDQKVCREVFSLPNDKKIVMFGAMYCTSDENKGFEFLVSALRKIAKTAHRNDIVAVVLGADNPAESFDIGLDTRFLGRLSDDTSLVVAYSAADVFVAPSKQENLPNMVMEAMSCGVPCVAFDIGGMPDMIKHGENGYLARPYDVDDLAQGILWGLLDNTSMSVCSKAARKKIELEYSEDVIAHRYASLYEQLLG